MRRNTTVLSLLILFLVVSCKQHEKGHQAEIRSLKAEVTALKNKTEAEEANKKLVAEFYQALFGDKNVDVIDQYIAEDYIQHNPILPDGRKPLKDWVTGMFKNAPAEKVDIRHLGADSNLVYIHTRANFGGKIFSVIDIFRVENNMIMEHWDVLQEVPEKSANPHPMF